MILTDQRPASRIITVLADQCLHMESCKRTDKVLLAFPVARKSSITSSSAVPAVMSHMNSIEVAEGLHWNINTPVVVPAVVVFFVCTDLAAFWSYMIRGHEAAT